MKKIYLLFLCALASLVGFEVNATTITLNVKADPAFVDKIQIGSNTDINDGKSSTFMNFSSEGVENTIDFTGLFVYCKVTLKVSSDKYNANIYKPDGTSTSVFKNKTGSPNGVIMGFANYDGGIFEVTPVEKEYVYVTIDGDPSKVEMSFQGQVVNGLTVGENKVECKNMYLTFKSLSGTKFYEFTYNDVPKEPTADQAEGSNPVYFYSFTSAKDNDRVYINTEFPVEKFNVSIDCGDYPEFVTSVTVDGQPVVNWADGFQVDYGQALHVDTDYNNYFVKSVLINNEPPAGFSGGYTKASVESDISLVFDVVPLERDKQITITVASPLGLKVYNDYKGTVYQYSGSASDMNHVINYSEMELPLTVETANTSSSTSYASYSRVAYINDVRVAIEFSDLTLTSENIKSGDHLHIDFVKPTFKVNCNDTDKLVANLFGKSATVTSGAAISIKTDPDPDKGETNTAVFSAAEGYEISSFLSNGAKVEGENGVFTVIPQTLDEYDITIRKSGDTGIDGVNADASAPAVYYNAQGMRVEKPAAGIYIMRQGDKVSKVFVK